MPKRASDNHPPKSLPWIRARLLDELTFIRDKVAEIADIVSDRVDMPKPEGRSLSAQAIMDEVAYETGVPVDEMVSESRERQVVEARDLAIKRIRSETTLSLPAIGRMFNRHHTTILSALRRSHDETRSE